MESSRRDAASGDALQRVPVAIFACGDACRYWPMPALADGDWQAPQPRCDVEIHRFEWQAVVKAGVA
jgi:hypothetical protein